MRRIEGARTHKRAMNSLSENVLAWCGAHDLVPPGASVAVACSGGPDSVALLHVLHELVRQRRLSVRLSVCHLDHGLRGAASREDRAFVEKLASRLGLACWSEHVNVPVKPDGHAAEDTARQARLAFFGRAARQLSADRVATAHTADDQAETILLRILRGTGLDGLAGIPVARPLEAAPDAPRLIRPLLNATREQVIGYLESYPAAWRDDASNADVRYARNRLRGLLPQLARDYNPQLHAALNRLGRLARESADVLADQAEALLQSSLRGFQQAEARIELDRESLRRAPPELARRALRRALLQVGAKQGAIGLMHLDQLVALLAAETGAARTLPGAIQAHVEYENLVLRRDPPTGAAAVGEPSFCLALSVPGEVVLPDGRRLSARFVSASGNGRQPDGGAAGAPGARAAEWLDPDALSSPRALTVRTRRPGDRFVPLGLGGAKKIKDYFIDEKIPRELRRRAVVVECGGEIIWLAPHRLADGVKLTPQTRQVLELRLHDS